MAALKPNSRLVLDYVKSVDGVSEVTAADIAEATGLEVKQVNGIVTSAFQKKIINGKSSSRNRIRRWNTQSS